MKSVTLKEIIDNHITLSSVNAKGWYECVHMTCDHGNKGNRAAFRFDNDVVTFHCFNCSIKTKYDPSTHKTIPHKMLTVLNDFGIYETELQQVVFTNFEKTIEFKKEQKIIKKTEPKSIQLPETFQLLKDATSTDKWAHVAKDYLINDRGINWMEYPFMIAKYSPNPKLIKWLKRLIIPIYKQDKLVFYQGRDLTNNSQKKYQNSDTQTSKVIYGFDQILNYNTVSPLYIVEGWFDAFVIDGIALLGNSISEEQAYWINKSNRKKVYVPDRFGNGKEVALHALELGWSISTPDIGSDISCKDMNDIVKKYGKMYTMKTLAENTTTGFAAKTQLSLYCK